MLVRRAFGLLGAVALVGTLAACAGGGTPYTQNGLPVASPTPASASPAPSAAPRRLALLVPVSGDKATLGNAMQRAAAVALSVANPPALDVEDTAGTPEGAAAAARRAVAAGVPLIIGPLTNAETAAVAPIARAAGVPVLSFTSDPAQAQPGIWTMGLTPAQQVRRLVTAAQGDNRPRFAALLPNGAYGDAMAAGLQAATASLSLPAPQIRRYGPSFGEISAAVKDLSGYATRRQPLDEKIRVARRQNDAEGRKQAADLSKEPIPPASFDVLLLGEGGEKLGQITSLLPYYDVGMPQVRLVGPAFWEADATRNPALVGAWYAAVDPDARASYVALYQAQAGAPPPALADLAYDATAIGRVLSQSGDYSTAALVRPDGFAGVDGVLGLLPDGHVRRGLAVFEIARDGAHKIQPAPPTLSSPGV